ncbi:hypothetical protein [Virgisporangium aurantiacum]|uniref:hypothetical protein n=1 Tax=Virgisporangium aurantiacum TaxID=175570 RepID=UPI0019521AE1|nr:hypothetical protein [Virgisporangium aurantiacum]
MTAVRLGIDLGTSNTVAFTTTTTGTATSRYTTDAWTVTITVVTSTKVVVQRRNGTVLSRYAVEPGAQSVWGFTCAGPELELCAGQLPTRTTFSRTTAAPPGAPSPRCTSSEIREASVG